MINYAHRGASEYMPENTLSAFYLGLAQRANGIETDIRRTKDGVLVLFHDATIDRVTTGTGNFHDYSYAELLKLQVKCSNTMTHEVDKILSFEHFLTYFAFRDLSFAIELKDEGIEKDVIDLIVKNNMKNKSVITSFSYDILSKVRSVNSEIEIGWLVRDITPEIIADLRDINAKQICPKADIITAESVKALVQDGFSVRAWGVKNIAIMNHVYNCGVNGMTVNFPDKLFELINGQCTT